MFMAQELYPTDAPKCRFFAEKMLEKFEDEEILLYDLLITDCSEQMDLQTLHCGERSWGMFYSGRSVSFLRLHLSLWHSAACREPGLAGGVLLQINTLSSYSPAPNELRLSQYYIYTSGLEIHFLFDCDIFCPPISYIRSVVVYFVAIHAPSPCKH